MSGSPMPVVSLGGWACSSLSPVREKRRGRRREKEVISLCGGVMDIFLFCFFVFVILFLFCSLFQEVEKGEYLVFQLARVLIGSIQDLLDGRSRSVRGLDIGEESARVSRTDVEVEEEEGMAEEEVRVVRRRKWRSMRKTLLLNWIYTNHLYLLLSISLFLLLLYFPYLVSPLPSPLLLSRFVVTYTSNVF